MKLLKRRSSGRIWSLLRRGIFGRLRLERDEFELNWIVAGCAPSPACGGRAGVGRRSDSQRSSGRHFPQPYPHLRCDTASPASGRGEEASARIGRQFNQKPFRFSLQRSWVQQHRHRAALPRPTFQRLAFQHLAWPACPAFACAGLFGLRRLKIGDQPRRWR